MSAFRQLSLLVMLLCPPLLGSHTDLAVCASTMSKLLLHTAHRHSTSGAVLLMQVSIMSAIRHPNVVLFMGVCLDPPCMVTEVGPTSPCITSAQSALISSHCSHVRLAHEVTLIFNVGPAPLLCSTELLSLDPCICCQSSWYVLSQCTAMSPFVHDCYSEG